MGFKYGNLEGTRKPFHVGTGADEPSAQLQADSTERGFLPPRMTTVQRDAIASPADGLMVFDTDFDEYYVFKSASWKQLSGVHVGDLAYYVDGTSGDDANGGTSWVDAKKTFTFTRETSKEIPRTIIGNLTLNVRGVVCSIDNVHNLDLKSFVVSGGIYVTGELTAVASGLAIDGYENTTTVLRHHTYITTTGAGWTPSAYKAHFVRINGAGEYYPILDNSADTVECMGLPDLSGASTYSISSASEIKGALTSDPSTLIAYVDEFLEEQDNNVAYLRFSYIKITSNPALTPRNWVRIGSRSSSKKVDWYYSAINTQFQPLDTGSHFIYQCWFNLDNYVSIIADIGIELSFTSTVFYATSRTGGGAYYYTGAQSFYACRFKEQETAINYYGQVDVYIYDIYIESSNIAFNVTATTMFLDGQTRLSDVTLGCHVAGGNLLVAADSTYILDSVVTEIKIDDSNTYTFAEIGTTNISNAATGSAVLVYDWGIGLVQQQDEYLNTASGLVATRFQTAIDELSARSIDADLTMYVDGTTGDDANDGLTWGTAKQTFGFLIEGATDAIPREINAALTVEFRNDIRARDANGHFVLYGFYGSGSITFQGVLTAVETFTASGYENDRTVQGSRQWVSDATKSWTPDQWRRHFVDLGHSIKYPIRTNNATTLFMGFGDDQAGSYAATIYSAPELLAELVTNPGVKYNFAQDKRVSVQFCTIRIVLKNAWIDEEPIDYYYPSLKNSKYFEFYNTALGPLSINYVTNLNLDGCYSNLKGYGAILSTLGSIFISNSAIDSTDSTGWGLFSYHGVECLLAESWVGHQTYGLWCTHGSVISLNREVYIQDCAYGITLEGGAIMFTPVTDPIIVRFDTITVAAIIGTGSISTELPATILGWDCAKEIVFSDTDEGSFADFSAQILNSRVQIQILYTDDNYYPVLLDEYNNTTSGLVATRFQTAIDELSARSIDADLTMYVDGSAGDDANDGLSWGAAKQTFGFLLEDEADSLPREINATVIIYFKNDIRARNDKGNLNLVNFYGSGDIQLIGELTAVETFTATTYENGQSVQASRLWVEDGTKAWTPGEWRRHFVDLGHTYLYPVQSNSSTRLWLGLGDPLAGAYSSTIYSAPQILRELVTDPGVKYALFDARFTATHNCSLSITLQNAWIDEDLTSTSFFWMSYCRALYMRNVALMGGQAQYCDTLFAVGCYFDFKEYGYFNALDTHFLLGNCAVDSTDATGYGLYISNSGYIRLSETWIINQVTAAWSGVGTYIQLVRDVYIEDSTDGLVLDGGALYCELEGTNDYPLRFDGLTRAIVGSGVITIVGAVGDFDVIGWNCTQEIAISDTVSALFSELSAHTLISQGPIIVSYIDWDFRPVLFEEYNNTTSGLVATRYQTAIDELAAAASAEAITTDLTMYVDGTAGSDANDGLAWGTAKKTLSFLYSGDAAALPREIQADVVVRTKGTILSATDQRHTTLDGFYGSGSISIIGEVDDVVTGLTPTGYDNTIENTTYHSFIEVSGASWTTDAYLGDFVQFTTPASDELYPIMGNSATQLETIGLPDLAGTETFKIVRLLTVFRASTVAAPSPLVNYPSPGIIRCDGCSLRLLLQRVNVAKDNYMPTGGRQVFWGQEGIIKISDDMDTVGLIEDAFVRECTIRALVMFGPSISIYGCCFAAVVINNDLSFWSLSPVTHISIERSVFRSDAGYLSDGMWSWYSDVTYVLREVRIFNCDTGIKLVGGKIISAEDVFIEGCNCGISGRNGIIDMYYGAYRFKDNVEAINLVGGGYLKSCPEWNPIYADGNTYDVVLWNLPAPGGLTFTEVNARTSMSNALTGACVIYYDDVDGEWLMSPSEYDNTTSGLVATRYQTAIDELAADIVDGPNYAQEVKVAKSGAEYTVIQDGLDSITDAATDKKYVVRVFPGEYDEEIVSKDNVDIIGNGPPRAIVIRSSTGTPVTMSNSGRSDLRNLTIERLSSVNDEHAVEVTAGTHLIYDCVLTQTSTDASGCVCHVSGTGVVQLNTGQVSLVQSGAATGSGNINRCVHNEGSGLVLIRGINAYLELGDAEDNACAFDDASAASGAVSWQNCFVDVNVTVAGFAGSAVAVCEHSNSVDKNVLTSRLRVRNSSGDPSGIGAAYRLDSDAGGARVLSAHNLIDVTGFASNYLGNIGTGDVLVSEFNAVDAVNGCIGAGSVLNEDGVKLLHGVVARSTAAGLNCLPTHITTTTFTLGATANPISYFYNGIKCTVSADTDATLDDGAGGSTAGLYFVYFVRATGAIEATKTFPGFAEGANVLIAFVYWNGTNYGLVTDERHSYKRNQQWHEWAHYTVGARYYSGFDFVPTGTGAAATFTMSGGDLYDEDIAFSAVASSSYPTPHTLRTWYQSGATAYTFDAVCGTTPFRAGAAGRPTYVNETGYVLTEASSAPNRYFNFFIYGVADMHTPTYCFAETVPAAIAATNGYTSEAAARAVRFPSLNAYGLSPELRPLYRLLVKANGVVIALISEDDYRRVTTLPQAAGSTSTSASAVTFIPAGGIASTNVQLALEELDLEKAPIASPTFTGVATTPQLKVTTGAVAGYFFKAAADGTGSWAAVNTTDLSTAVNGVLKGNGTGVVVATAGTDYAGIGSANTFTGVNNFENAAGVEIGKDDATNTAGVIKLWGAGSNNFYTTFTAATQSANATYTWPTAMPAVTGYVLSCTDAGVMSWAAVATAGANTALSNLAAVAINTHLLPGTDDGATLGNASFSFSDLYLAAGGVINWANSNSTITHSTGILTFGGCKIGTGGELAPDVDPGGICINHGAGDDASLTIKNSDVAHPFTTYSQTDTYLEIRKHVSESGGALIRGFTEATTAFEYRGYSVTASTGDYACIQLTAYYTDGGTGVTDFSANSHIVGFRNNGVPKHFFNGGGDAVFVGALTVGARVGTSTPAGTMQWSGTQFQGYDGAAWRTFDNHLIVPADHAWSGTTMSAVAGETVALGDLCYLKSDGKFWLADADAQATADGMLAIATAAIAGDATGVFLLRGLFRDDTWAWTVGGKLYISATPGNPTQTAPSTTGQILRVAGHAYSADVLYFNPDNTFVELS